MCENDGWVGTGGDGMEKSKRASKRPNRERNDGVYIN